MYIINKSNKYKKAFTLIETLMAVVIISIVGYALLQTHSNVIHSLTLFADRMKVNEYSSILFSKISKDFHNKKRDLYEYAKEIYSINDDDLIKFLKKEEFLYKQEELYFMRLGESEDGNGLNEDLMAEFERRDENGEIIKSVEGAGISIEQITISNDNNLSTFIYHFTYEINESK